MSGRSTKQRFVPSRIQRLAWSTGLSHFATLGFATSGSGSAVVAAALPRVDGEPALGAALELATVGAVGAAAVALAIGALIVVVG